MSKVFKCLAVDDNPSALRMLTLLVNDDKGLQLIHADTKANRAYEMIEKNEVEPDLIFLDLEMREMHGTEFAKKVQGGPMVIFTTAHREFGPESHQLDVVDYLLKPISKDMFDQAILKARKRWDIEQKLQQPPDKIVIPGNGKDKRIQIPTENIVYGKASRNYTDVFMKVGKHTTFLTVKDFESLLPKPHFVRIHRSYFINISQIKERDAFSITLSNDVILPIGGKYKIGVNELLKKDRPS